MARSLLNSAPGISQSLRPPALHRAHSLRRLRNSHADAIPFLGAVKWPSRANCRKYMSKASLVSIVENDQYFRESMRRLMRSLGYDVEAFSSAADFLASPRLIKTACLIADVQMPAMTGLELYRHLIEARYTIPTILVTAYPNAVDRTRALNDGVVCYLRKPLDDQDLIQCLRAALSSGEPSEGNS